MLTSAKTLAKFGLRLGAYDGARKRRFVLFESLSSGHESRSEFDTKKERDAVALRRLDVLRLNPPSTPPTPKPQT